MTTGRNHSFAEGPVYPVAPRPQPRFPGRLWMRFVKRIQRKLEQELQYRASESFRTRSIFGKNLLVKPDAYCQNPGPVKNIRIGNNVVIGGILASERFHPGQIIIGDDVYIGDATLISCAERVEIGSHSLIAHGVQIFDNNSHPVEAEIRAIDYDISRGVRAGARAPISRAPVTLGKNVWIGLNAVILRGVNIGEGAVVGAGSVVTKNVAPYTMVAGNPARAVRTIQRVGLTVARADESVEATDVPETPELAGWLNATGTTLAEKNERPVPLAEGATFQPATRTSFYSPLLLSPSTLGELASRADTIREIIKLVHSFETDDYLETLIPYLQAGLQRYGDAWRYADILTGLFAACRTISPTSYLEIGVRRGRSMAIVAASCPDVEIVGFDMWMPDYGGMPNDGSAAARKELEKCGHRGTLEMIDGDSHVTVPAYFQAHPDKYFDLITVDGDHSEEGAQRDLEVVMPRLKVGGVLVFDDIKQYPVLYRLWKRTVVADTRFATWEFSELGYGIALAVRVSA